MNRVCTCAVCSFGVSRNSVLFGLHCWLLSNFDSLVHSGIEWWLLSFDFYWLISNISKDFDEAFLIIYLFVNIEHRLSTHYIMCFLSVATFAKQWGHCGQLVFAIRINFKFNENENAKTPKRNFIPRKDNFNILRSTSHDPHVSENKINKNLIFATHRIHIYEIGILETWTFPKFLGIYTNNEN